MAPYVMAIKIVNNTDKDLNFLKSAFYNGDGDQQQAGSLVAAHSTGDGGVLEKAGGTDGLFGLVAYSTPDPARTLVVYIAMPATSGTFNHCTVGLISSNTPIDDNLATNVYNGALPGFTEGRITWTYAQNGQQFALLTTPALASGKDINTYSTITLDLYRHV